MTDLDTSRTLAAQQVEVVARAVRAIQQHVKVCEDTQDLTLEATQALRESGFTRLTLPVAQGGLDATLTHFTAVQLELGRENGSLALVLAMQGNVTGVACRAPRPHRKWRSGAAG